MSKKNCNHRSFWEIYKIINFNRTFCEEKGRKFTCSKCGKKCKLKWRGYKEMKKSGFKKYLTYFLWMLPAIILIFLSVTQIISYWSAILYIIIFHFWAMYFIVNSDRLEIKCK